MNNKGFAISIIMYTLVFLLVTIFYIILGTVKARYTTSLKLRESIIEQLNNDGKLYETIVSLGDKSDINYIEKYNVSNGLPIDTPDGSGNKDVYYFTSSTSSNLAGQNSNVIFGDFCWQIVRTTATGGVKLIYNGPKTSDNKCPNNASLRPSTIGVVGKGTKIDNTLSGEKKYGTSFEIIDDNGTKKFKLKNIGNYTWSSSTYEDIIGKFVCGTSSSITGTSDICDYLYFVGGYYSDTKASTTKYNIGETAHFSQIGTSSFNAYYNSPAYVGYMYNDLYTYSSVNFSSTQEIISYLSASYSFYYGDKATWNPDTNMYDLTVDDGEGHDITPTSLTAWADIRNNAMGKYTCRSASTSCATVYYIVSNSTGTYMNCIPLSNNESADSKSVTWTYGTGYEENNGVYTLTGVDTLTFLLKDWPTTYSQYKQIYVCNDFTSTTCPSEAFYISASGSRSIDYNRSSRNYIYGNSVRYENGSYYINTDSDPTKYHQIWDWNKKYKTISHSHYTCFRTDSNECGSNVGFVIYADYTAAYYFRVWDDDRIGDILQKMFNVSNSSTSNLNRYNSAMKGVLESWYASNLLNLSDYIDDDAVFCNDRTITSYGGWDPEGSPNSNYLLKFKQSATVPKKDASLECTNITDRFSKNNVGMAELQYPVGLLTEPERAMMFYYYSKTGQIYWLMSPYAYYSSDANNDIENSTQNGSRHSVNTAYAVRPVIVLKPGIKATGDGTYNDPYIVLTE